MLVAAHALESGIVGQGALQSGGTQIVVQVHQQAIFSAELHHVVNEVGILLPPFPDETELDAGDAPFAVSLDRSEEPRLNSVTNAHLVCRLLLETKKLQPVYYSQLAVTHNP